MFNLPNTLSLSRIVAVPILFYLAWVDRPRLFLLLLACSLMTDVLDGFFARKMKKETGLGAKLDSWGDFAVFMSLPFCAWWLWPDLIHQETLFIVAVIASYTIPILFGFLKYRRLTSYHTWGAKVSGILITISVFLLLAARITSPFRIAAFVLALSAIEEISITMILTNWQANVPSLWHAVQISRHQHGESQIPPR
jgi:CDP-diacylglycerol--glycerol-3-phosphate 3-phosphatidyltransferase